MNKEKKLITDLDFDPNKRKLAERMIQWTIAMLSATSVAKAANISWLVKAAVHKRIHELPDSVVEAGLKEPENSPVWKIKRWATQASNQVMHWVSKTKKVI